MRAPENPRQISEFLLFPIDDYAVMDKKLSSRQKLSSESSHTRSAEAQAEKRTGHDALLQTCCCLQQATRQPGPGHRMLQTIVTRNVRRHQRFKHIAGRIVGLALVLAAGLFAPGVANADGEPVFGEELEGFDYGYPVHVFEFTSQGQSLHMSYLDVVPSRANGRTAVLLHGKNFCAGTWIDTLKALVANGYRVIAPDQIGFCKSSKPRSYQFSFEQLAHNTRALLASLDVGSSIFIGHSTGGMLAVRYALMYPQATEALVLVDPVGLEDWQAKGVPWPAIDAWYQREVKTTAERLRNYERDTYYGGKWDATFEKWVQMLAGMYRGPGKEAVAWDSALIDDMIFTQPVLYEFPRIEPRTLLIIGDLDNTAPGKEMAPESVKATLGHYPELGREAARHIPHVDLVEFADLGHAPQIQDPARFQRTLLDWLKAED
jgi:pimeloyl-ACP methyl ester carboxylesterase